MGGMDYGEHCEDLSIFCKKKKRLTGYCPYFVSRSVRDFHGSLTLELAFWVIYGLRRA